jgi:hypothetical protein
MAPKLACLFYRLIQHGQQYVDKGMEYYEAKYREQQIRSLMKRAPKLGFQLVASETASGFLVSFGLLFSRSRALGPGVFDSDNPALIAGRPSGRRTQAPSAEFV